MGGGIGFRILGPLVVERGGESVPLGGSKQRLLLASLLLHANEVLTTDALVERLWGEDPPPTARTALQVQVSKLRKLVGPNGPKTIETHDPGYALRIDPEELDLTRFELLAEDGRSALARGETQRAHDLLSRALELWRGEPLAGLDLAPADTPIVTALGERRLRALESRLEADLALGLHDEVVQELDSLCAETPLSERVHALSALALYRAGRQAEALDRLARLRRALSEELGIEPGEAVARLERQILNRDPELALSAAAEPEGDDVVRRARKTVSVVVCEVAPRAGSGRDPEKHHRSMEGILDAARRVISSYGGSVQDELGGRVVSVFGLPRVHEDDASRAVQAAAALRELAGSKEGVAVRVGIASGEVLVEEANGDSSLLSAAPIEDAASLAREARSGEVLLDAPTLKLARAVATAEPADVLRRDVDGSAVPTFRLERVMQDESAMRPRPALVGRREELTVLRQALSRVARDRSCSLVTISGPAGVGKSRLVSAFLEELDDDTTVLEGRCLPYGQDITFWPVAEMVRHAAGILDEEGPAAVRARVAELLGDQEDAAFLQDQILAVLGSTDVDPVPEEIFWAIRKVFEGEAAGGQLVIVVDDIQWGDSPLLDLIEYVVARTRGAPVLVVCMARPDLLERRPGWGSGRLDATNLSLPSLTRDESSALIANLLMGAELDDDDRRQILDAAEGNPLFIEELISMLIDDGILRPSKSGWTAAGELSDVPIPPTVNALLGARLDRLDPNERALLERASVVGKEFTSRDLAALAGDDDEGTLVQELEALIAKDLIVLERLSPASGREYRFRHLLLRDAVYRTMPKELRAQVHEAFGTSLEERAGDRIAEYEEIVGYHLENAHAYRTELGIVDDDTSALAARAAALFVSAGRRALALGDLHAGANLLRRTVALLDDADPRLPEAAWLLTLALFDMGDLTECEAVGTRGLQAATALGDDAFAWRLRLELMEVQHAVEPDRYRFQEAENVGHAALDAFETAGDQSGRARALRFLGDTMGGAGRQRECVETLVLAQQVALEAGDVREATVRSNLGVVLSPVPVEEGIRLIERSMSFARRPHPDARAGLALLYAMVGRFEESQQEADEGLARAHELGQELVAASVAMHAAAARLLADDPSGAESVIRPAVESLQRMGERTFLSTAVAILAEALWRQRRLDEAMLATLISEDATSPDDVASAMAWRGVRAKILADRGELREAERLAREASDLAERTEYVVLAADVFLDHAIVLETKGDVDGAANRLNDALRLYEEKGSTVGAARARQMLERVLAERGADAAGA